jgi:prephenate dehydrogenase
MKIGIVGLGLIGGSIARDLNSQINVEVIGVESDVMHATKAMELGLVNKIVPLADAESICDVLILAMPVHGIESLLPQLLDRVTSSKTIIDVGSTKSSISEAVSTHHMRGRYVAAHPLAGTEFSGPTAALKGLFQGKKNILCDGDKSDEDARNLTIKIFDSIGMKTIFMPSEEHDKHLAYVSHLSHVSSFMLGLTVLEIEKDEKQIFNLAGTGFESTVRLAKSNPETWSAIFDKNKKYVSTALGGYIHYLSKFKEALDAGDTDKLKEYMREANVIKEVLQNR